MMNIGHRGSLSSLPRTITERLNVDHLSVGMGDHLFVWRSSLTPHRLIQFERWPGHDYWVEHNGDGHWSRAGRHGCRARRGERFIRVGRVIADG